MNAVLSSNSSNQVPTNQHSFLLPVWLIFFSSSSSTISSSSFLQMTWEHSFPSSKCEQPFLIWCADHFQLLAGWWKSFKNSWGKKNISTFFQEPCFISRTFFFFIIPYLWLWWTLLFIISFFFWWWCNTFVYRLLHYFTMVYNFLLHHHVLFLTWRRRLFFFNCHLFWTPSLPYHHLLPLLENGGHPRLVCSSCFYWFAHEISWKCTHCQLWLSSSIVLHKTKVKRKMWWIK